MHLKAQARRHLIPFFAMPPSIVHSKAFSRTHMHPCMHQSIINESIPNPHRANKQQEAASQKQTKESKSRINQSMWCDSSKSDRKIMETAESPEGAELRSPPWLDRLTCYRRPYMVGPHSHEKERQHNQDKNGLHCMQPQPSLLVSSSHPLDNFLVALLP